MSRQYLALRGARHRKNRYRRWRRIPSGLPPADLTTPIHRQPQRFEGASQRRRNERSPLYPSPPGADRNPSPDLCRQGLCSKKCGAVPVRVCGEWREQSAKSRTQKRSVNQLWGHRSIPHIDTMLPAVQPRVQHPRRPPPRRAANQPKITRSQNARRRRRTSHKSTGEGEAIGEAANEVDGEEIEWFYVRVVDPWRRSGES